MGWFKKKPLDVEQLRRVVNLIQEYVDALIDERMGARAIAEGLDGRELHGPAVRKLKKVEARIAEILGVNRKSAEVAEVRSAGLPGALLTDEQRKGISTTEGAEAQRLSCLPGGVLKRHQFTGDTTLEVAP